MRETETAALLALLRIAPRGTGWGEIAARVSAEGSAQTLLLGAADALFPNPETEAALDQAASQLCTWRAAGHQLTTVLEQEYPHQLRDIRDMPPFLFYTGDLRTEDPGMSVVGSRLASKRGLSIARSTAELLVERGLTVIAGLAEGIDTAAHRAALSMGGRTVAIIGTGITRRYPASNADLQDEIARRGVVVSQFYPDAPPTRSSFPMRNVTMSGYGLATIVIEASEHSGSRIQARVAGQHGRPVILTSNVVESTSWGRALVGNPNVFVASSISEMQEAIHAVQDAPKQLDDALAALVASR